MGNQQMMAGPANTVMPQQNGMGGSGPLGGPQGQMTHQGPMMQQMRPQVQFVDQNGRVIPQSG